jgi:hypothetical protein
LRDLASIATRWESYGPVEPPGEGLAEADPLGVLGGVEELLADPLGEALVELADPLGVELGPSGVGPNPSV